MRLTRYAFAVLPAACGFAAALTAAPLQWVSRGPGGGGAFFAPGINPYNPAQVYVSSDMTDVFRTDDSGASWRTLDFRQLEGGNGFSGVQFTSNSNLLYTLNGSAAARSADGGRTWGLIPASPSSLYCLYADPQATNRLLAANYTTLYLSTNGGASFAAKYTTNDFHIAGAFFDGSRIFVGTRIGLLVSTNNGAQFKRDAATGIPAAEAMVSFAGTRQGGSAPRLFCVTLGSGDVYPGVSGGSYSSYLGIYRLDYGAASWQRTVNGIGSDFPFFVATVPNDTNTAYAAGSSAAGEPAVFRTADGGASWQKVMRVSSNANVFTGWQGDDPGAWNWRKWSYGECAMGFAVCASDPARAVITDLGFVHMTTNGGASWYAACTSSSDWNPTNSPTDKTKAYHGVGIENTSSWWLCWPNSRQIVAGFTDMRGILSTNAGRSWTFPATLTYNSTYQIVRHPSNGVLYAAVSSVHDLYAWDHYCEDTYIDGGSGEVLYSTNNGVAWQRLHNFGRPVVAIALDPSRTNRMYASMVNSASGGIYRTDNLQAGAASTWAKQGVPPRTEGHPYVIGVLTDGTVVCSYSARITSDFTASAGVFVSTNSGASWLDRSAAGMRYYTKDVVIDPHDPAQNRWYAGVWGEWGNSSGLGGLYMTTNRGVAWTRVTSGIDQVGSCTISPLTPDEMYVTTENQGLWCSTNRRSATPVFSSVTNYPFRFPSRVFYNPWNTNEIWVTSFGNGLRLGRVVEPAPQFISLGIDTNSDVVAGIAGASGQRIALQASPVVGGWQAISTRAILDDDLVVRDRGAGTNVCRFYRAVVDIP